MSAWVQAPGLVLVVGLVREESERFARERLPRGAWLDGGAESAGEVEARLRAGALTAIALDEPSDAEVEPLLVAVKRAHLPCVVLALDADPERCAERLGPGAPIRQLNHRKRLLGSRLPVLSKRKVVTSVQRLDEAAMASGEVEVRPLPCDRRGETGAFDVIGDVHGCMDELEALLGLLGYAEADGAWRHPEGRRVVFAGDLCDRGPRNLDVLRAAMAMSSAGTGLCVLGNHDDKLARFLEKGKRIRVSRGLALTVAELEALSEADGPAFRAEALAYLRSLPSHLVLDGGALVVAHGGIKEELIGRVGPRVSAFTKYGDTTGETDADGYPVRLDWAQDYSGSARIVYGHTPTPAPRWVNGTINIDQGCVFGGELTALRYPELETVQVPAGEAYFAREGGA